MRKLRNLICFLSVCLFIVPVALAQSKPYVNPVFNPSEMSTISGKKVTFSEQDGLAGEVELGFAFHVPDAWKDMVEKLEYYFDESAVTFFYLPEQFQADYDKLPDMEKDAATALYEKLTKEMIALLSVVRINPNNPMDQKLQEKYQKEYYKQFDLLAQNGENNYYVAYTPELAQKTLGAEEKEALNAMVRAGVQHLRENLILFPAQDYFDYYGVDEQSVDVVFDQSFAVKDLEGKDFTARNFADYDLTVINIWSTTCGPCVEEMPLLAQLHEQLPKNVNLITICLDAAEETDFAKQVVGHAKAKFQTLIGDDIASTVMKNIEATPTALFVDAKGQPVGAAVVGAPAGAEEFVSKYLEIIQQRLDGLK